MSDTVFTLLVLPKLMLTAVDHRWSMDHSLRNTVLLHRVIVMERPRKKSEDNIEINNEGMCLEVGR